jgi:hypothetical protein
MTKQESIYWQGEFEDEALLAIERAGEKLLNERTSDAELNPYSEDSWHFRIS